MHEKQVQKWIDRNLLPLLMAIDLRITSCAYRVVQDKASVLLTYESTTGKQRYREIPVFHTYGKGLVKDVLKGI